MKRKIILSALILVLTVVFILPGVAERVKFEENSKVYIAAVDLTRIAKFFEDEDIPEILDKYIDAGVTTAIIHENRGHYPRALLDIAKASGVNIAITPDATTWLDADIENIIRDYEVKYINLQTSTMVSKPQAKGKSDIVCPLIKKYDLPLIINEHYLQLGNDEPMNFEDYLEAADGKILRCYRSYNRTNVDVMDYPAVYYQTYISVTDRNTRFVNIKQLDDEGFTEFENAERTIENTRLLCQKLESEGYKNEGMVDYDDYAKYESMLPRISAGVAAIAVLMLALMLELLFNKRISTFLGIIAAAGAFALTLVLPDSLTSLYPTLFATFAPCFAITVVALFIHSTKERLNTAVLTLCAVSITLSLFMFTGTILVALLGGHDYFLNIGVFRGVKMSLIAPMVWAVALLAADAYKKYTLAEYKEIVIGVIRKIRWYHIVIIAATAVAAVIYVIRSGNVNKISFTETVIRNWLTEVFGARPRTKEILAGWPCLVLYIYFAKQNRYPLLKWIFAIGASTLFASAANTFCHVFTMAETMYLRVLVGALFGIPLAVFALLICIAVIQKLDKRRLLKN